jgi:broad specificity phosphatase PhoE
MKLIMIRHGQTQINRNHMVQGRSNFPLTDQGIKEAVNSGDILKKNVKHVDVFISSPSMRALQTTQIISGKYNHPNFVITDEHFYERDFGPYDGRLIEDVFPIKVELPGYETDSEIQNRVHTGVMNIYKKYKGKTVVIGCHSHTIKSILSVIEPDLFTYRTLLVNGAIAELKVDDEGIKYVQMIYNN